MVESSRPDASGDQSILITLQILASASVKHDFVGFPPPHSWSRSFKATLEFSVIRMVWYRAPCGSSRAVGCDLHRALLIEAMVVSLGHMRSVYNRDTRLRLSNHVGSKTEKRTETAGPSPRYSPVRSTLLQFSLHLEWTSLWGSPTPA